MRTSVWTGLLVVALLGLAGGCRARTGPTGVVQVQSPRHLVRYERHLVRLAAREAGCARDQAQVMRIGEVLWTAHTCRGPREYMLQCGGGRRYRNCRWIPLGSAPEAAAQYLGCPPPAMQQQPGPTPTSRVVMGCGRQLMMQIGCGPGGCGWMASAPPQGNAPPPPPGYGAPPPGYGQGGVQGGAQGGGQVIVVPAN